MLVSKKNQALIVEWKKAKTALSELKEKESDLRDKIVDVLFPERVEGTNKVDLGHGYGINCRQEYKYDIDEDKLKDVVKLLPKGTKKKLTKTSISLVKKEYRNLSEEAREIFDECLTLIPNKAQLEITTPKENDLTHGNK